MTKQKNYSSSDAKKQSKSETHIASLSECDTSCKTPAMKKRVKQHEVNRQHPLYLHK